MNGRGIFRFKDLGQRFRRFLTSLPSLLVMSESRQRRSPPPTPNPLTRFDSMSPVSPFFPRPFSPSPPPSYAARPPTPKGKSSVLALTRTRRPVFCSVFAILFGILIYLNIAFYRSSGFSIHLAQAQHLDDTTEMPAARISKKPRIERLKVLRGEATEKFRGACIAKSGRDVADLGVCRQSSRRSQLRALVDLSGLE